MLVKRELFDQSGEIKPLTSLQSKYAYGIETKESGTNNFKLKQVSYTQQKLYVRLDKNHHAYVATTLDGKHLIVDRLFIHQIDGTTGLKTKVDQITFFRKDKQGEPIRMVLSLSN